MPAAENTRNRQHAAGRRSRTEGVTPTRRGARQPHDAVADGGRGQAATESIHVTPNAIMASRGIWDLGGVVRFARWLTDGATDRPHLRF
ncbi:MAG: hypothetical protein AVDCRST_MAG65-1567 [uncultured Solirubrobacteraceae bacterium]|uniref:Uncharacterized protein n=1 Tax=uncultured Solirubrobacteraceae bacterium TaxID=1162706 RepID=A0A6J4RVV1_9ACTN|nr:MAG: hypothetical protein AVDCRST_MAG65-1567 [uncultured Solirubrobacteraceae bacterium]